MTLDKAIERYTNNAEFERTHGNLQGCLDFRQLAEWLKELKQLREQTTWIPVSERLPDECDYKSCYEVEDGAVFWTNEEGLVGMGYYYESTKTWSDIEDNPVSVTAWMQLPQPYKAESEE